MNNILPDMDNIKKGSSIPARAFLNYGLGLLINVIGFLLLLAGVLLVAHIAGVHINLGVSY